MPTYSGLDKSQTVNLEGGVFTGHMPHSSLS